ncbi:hypothetical protein D910_04682 [Dendroctonus ponderosae]
MESFGNLFAPEQHGFLPGVSTVSKLFVWTNFAGEAINNKLQLDVIITDCSNTFDMVDHGILLQRLNEIGFSDKALAFVRPYFHLTFQQVKVGGCLSKKFQATSGVPQGNNLRPLLFLIFINFLPDCLRYSSGLGFADGFKFFRVVRTLKDCLELQKHLNEVSNWFKGNGMFLNEEKCGVLSFTRKLSFIDGHYNVNKRTLVRKTTCRDLGVHLKASLRFGKHYTNITSKSYKILGFVIRNSKHVHIDTTIRFYNALVRPHLKYASVDMGSSS